MTDVPASEENPIAGAAQEVNSEPTLSAGSTTPVTPTRVSASWTAVVAAAFVLILLVIFIAQNTQQSTVKFLWAHGKAPTSVVLLIAAIAGALVVIIVGVARIVQLRRTAKHAAHGKP